ncbi:MULTISPECIES: hypothetical protein [Sphingobacterium]|uniref:Adhesin n=1 Tax=Sphingobacterium ginsenosidimutans TaxID=687845 RepID=A0ABP7ZZ55_9SPHI|nr:hypothetical protein [Sphingobacterium sp. E70]ULT27220.1 hypothetical protein KUH03_10945 [Sphingobacterium sp. E70]
MNTAILANEDLEEVKFASFNGPDDDDDDFENDDFEIPEIEGLDEFDDDDEF